METSQSAGYWMIQTSAKPSTIASNSNHAPLLRDVGVE
jgi:hypothetical protein